MSEFTVTWEKRWEGPVRDPATCPHSNEFGSEVLTINQRLEPHKRKGRQIRLDGTVCMNCGTDLEGRFSTAEALHLCMEQHGWNRRVGERLHELAAAHKEELMRSPAIPIWCLYAFGMSGREIHQALNSGKLHPAHMSEEVEQLAEQVSDWKRRRA